jgi:hypothetical protein
LIFGFDRNKQFGLGQVDHSGPDIVTHQETLPSFAIDHGRANQFSTELSCLGLERMRKPLVREGGQAGGGWARQVLHPFHPRPISQGLQCLFGPRIVTQTLTGDDAIAVGDVTATGGHGDMVVYDVDGIRRPAHALARILLHQLFDAIPNRFRKWVQGNPLGFGYHSIFANGFGRKGCRHLINHVRWAAPHGPVQVIDQSAPCEPG